MPKFCSELCESICDFCKHYRDDSENEINPDNLFSGAGLCEIQNIRVNADEGIKCQYFECCNVL